MRFVAIVVTCVMVAFSVASKAGAAVKKVLYPEVKVKIFEAYRPDAAFKAMLNSFADAVTKKDAQALSALVGPTFVWTPHVDYDRLGLKFMTWDAWTARQRVKHEAHIVGLRASP
jgi:hypothetical protein